MSETFTHSTLREYELYVPLHDNEGAPVPPERLSRLRALLVERFGGLTHFPQENEGLWKVGSTTFRDRIVILRFLGPATQDSEQFLARLKEELKKDWQQEDVLIIARDVRVVE